MDKVKNAASSFLSGDGKHKTTIDQDVRKATTEEQVRPHQHEQVTNAVDKEIHQEHHQTRVQPILHKETLPEKHTENVLPTQHKTIHHGNEDQTRATLDREAGKFRDTSVTHETTRSTETAPTMTGERIHHHVHEHVQPVIQKETVAPTVVHTTVPIHETHHAAPVHHEATVLPPKTMGEFSGTGAIPLEGRGTQKVQEFEGCPQPQHRTEDAGRKIHGENLGVAGTAADITHGHHHHGHRSENVGGAAVGTGLAGAGAAGIAGAEHKKHRNKLGRSGSSSSSSSDDGKTGRHTRSKGGLGAAGAGAGVGAGMAGTHQQEHKPSLMDKLNPKKDADGDGKAGFMK